MTTQLTIPDQALQFVEIPAFSALTTTVRATLPTLPGIARPVALRLHQEADRLGLDLSQPMQWVYTGVNGDNTNEFQVELTLPTTLLNGELPADMSFKTFPAFPCLRYTYTGSYADFGDVYDQLFQQFYRSGYKNDGRIREVYIVIDTETPENCVTDIQIGIAGR